MLFDEAWALVSVRPVLLALPPLPLLAQISSSSSHLRSLEPSGSAPRLAALPVKKTVVCDPMVSLALWSFLQKLLLVIASSFSRHELDVLRLLAVKPLLVFEIAPPWSSVATRLDRWLTRRRQQLGDRVFSSV
jgi:hypothetical protein